METLDRAVAEGEKWKSLAALKQLHNDLAGCCPTPVKYLKVQDLEPLLGTFGITRVADVTGLDNLGIPNRNAIRPNARGIVVSAGKGLDDDAAWVSAVMESLEEANAEDARKLSSFVDTLNGLESRGARPIPLARQSRCDFDRISREQEFAWVPGISLRYGAEVFAPYELVGLDLAANAPWDTTAFRMSSVGIGASGNVAGAVLQALRELIEDDALFASSALVKTSKLSKCGTINIPCPQKHALPQLCNRLQTKGIFPEFALLPSPFSYPTFIATLHPVEESPQIAMQFQGYACRRTKADAALGALLEAVQTRLTFISGSREDLYQEEYSQNRDGFSYGNFFTPAFGEHEVEKAIKYDREIEAILNDLFSNGVNDLYAFPLGSVPGVFDVVRLLGDDLMTPDRAANKPLHGRAKSMFLSDTILS